MTDWKPCCRLLAVVAAPAAGRSACSCSASRTLAVVSRFFGNTDPTLMGFLAPEGLVPRHQHPPPRSSLQHSGLPQREDGPFLVLP